MIHISTDAVLSIGLFVIVAGFVGAVSILAAEHVRKWLWDGQPGTKPRPYKISVQDADGWPYRSFTVTPEIAGRLVRELESDRERETGKKN